MNETVGRVGISGRFGKTWKSDRDIISLINIDQVDVRADVGSAFCFTVILSKRGTQEIPFESS